MNDESSYLNTNHNIIAEESMVSSDSFVLNINSQRSLTNPYDQSKRPKKVPEQNDLTNIIILDYYLGSKAWIIASIFLVSFYYGVVVFLNVDFISTKIYQSFSIGFMILIDKMFFIKSNFKEDTIDEAFNGDPEEPLVNNRSPRNADKYSRMKSDYEDTLFQEAKAYIICSGIINFICELSVFYILKRTELFRLNASLGLIVLGVEFIIIKLNQTLVISIMLVHLLAIFMSITILIVSIVLYLDYTFLFLGVIVSILRFINLFIMQYLRKEGLNYNYLPWINSIDFILGAFFFLIILTFNKSIIFYTFGEFFLIFIGTFCYYFNMKYFGKQNKHFRSLLSFNFIIIGIIDFYVNDMTIDLCQSILVVVFCVSIYLMYCGDEMVENINQMTNENAASQKIEAKEEEGKEEEAKKKVSEDQRTNGPNINSTNINNTATINANVNVNQSTRIPDRRTSHPLLKKRRSKLFN